MEDTSQASAPSWFASLDPKTRLRLRTTLLGTVDYCINAAGLLCFALAGAVSYRFLAAVLAYTIVVNALALGGIASGYSRRLRDPSLTAFQVFAACAMNLAGIAFAPQLAYLFIINLFVPLSYSSLHFNRRTYIATWVLLSAALALILSARIDVKVNIATPMERALFWGVVAVALGRFLAINARVSRLRERLHRKNDELAAAGTRMKELTSRDELTGLWNRREFMRLMHDESRRAARNRGTFCVALIDVDRFRDVNDRFGHLVGDAALHELGQLLELTRRASDSAARYGEEEFALLLVNARLATATVALERMRHQIGEHGWNEIAPDLRLTVSAGVAEWRPGETLVQLLNRADAAMVAAKHAGRNCVRAALD